ncbi:MAG: enoyl-CoA hydratase [Alphaproteobacteria bacterium]|nr:MAG: enoyl-CoA hydratase [Alphaproteobacteria bacterium]
MECCHRKGSAMELKTIDYEQRGRVALITLARPHRMNAWTGRMHTEYRHCLEQAEQDARIGAIVITGKGRAFCAGADMAALEGHVEKGGYDPGTPDPLAEPGFGVRPEFDASFAYHFGLSKPVIAAINGAAAGVGLVLACFADIRFAAKGAKFTAAHGRFNFPAEFGLSWVLPRQIGLTRAMDLLLTSRIFLSEEAMEMGLLNRLLETEDVLPEALAYAQSLTENIAPASLRETKWQVYTDLHRDVASAVNTSEELIENLSTEPDYKEGVRAFTQKQKPHWRKYQS